MQTHLRELSAFAPFDSEQGEELLRALEAISQFWVNTFLRHSWIVWMA